MLRALVYFLQAAKSGSDYLLAFPKAIVWPALLATSCSRASTADIHSHGQQWGLLLGHGHRGARMRGRGRSRWPRCHWHSTRSLESACEEDRLPVVRTLVGIAPLARALGLGRAHPVDRARRGGRVSGCRRCVLPRPPLRPATCVAVPAPGGDRRSHRAHRDRDRRRRHALREPALHGRRCWRGRPDPRVVACSWGSAADHPSRSSMASDTSATSRPRAGPMPTWPASTPRSSCRRCPAPGSPSRTPPRCSRTRPACSAPSRIRPGCATGSGGAPDRARRRNGPPSRA